MIPMRDALLHVVRDFLDGRGEGPLLLGYSGGPDSKALLHLLLACGREVHLAHIDHGWREESSAEAALLQEEAESLGLPFHLLRLAAADFHPGNLEEQGREARLDFFSKTYAALQAKALVLGHHADDQAEVVLKRLFEGSSLLSLSGMQGESILRGMRVWRPLLGVRKASILSWLKERGISAIEDATNLDSRFLRGRMRSRLLPDLAKEFGKEIVPALCRLGGEAHEMEAYFSSLNAPLLKLARKEPGKLNLTGILPIHPLQLKYLFKQWMAEEQIHLSHVQVEQVVHRLLERGARKSFETKSFNCSVEYGVCEIIN
ncbi:MAG: tRNA lysidine(34) synthetase TilS [Verrucomicrobia bacterium]|nr:tRNA lysidine(34) synthetase TilS [Verrucomicrobiota bacterium]